jgi:putative membrane-bound dehydrogenase-like protein
MVQGQRRGFLLALATLVTACRRQVGPPPFAPDEALKTLRIEDGFRVELFAAEPSIASPVAMEFDENGRIFVVEMPGYPIDTRPTGRIRLLEDRDGDGRPERSTVFADGLVLPSGVMRSKKGVLVTAAPDVWYLEDADGDGEAERREKVLTGFAFTNPQHMVNTPVFGLDNWIYLAHEGPAEAVIYKELFGDAGAAVRFPEKPDAPAVVVGRHAVRFRPDTFTIEARSGSSQFGHAFDEWGRYFTLDNSNHLRHEVIASRYLKRNPDLPVGNAMQNISDHGSNAKVFAITKRPRFELLTEPGEFTSACSLTLELGGAFPTSRGRTSFVAEPAQNLVHRDVWTDAGSTFSARRAQEGAEFLASTDSWFRPVNMTIGPDGALYVVDYYRQMIEHPEWTSTHVHKHEKDMYAGQDRGRIWRITPAGGSPAGAKQTARPRLGSASDEELVATLAHDNAWWRRTAQRLLVERRREDAAPALRRLFAESPKALARLHALWTLEGLGRLDDALILRALEDPEPGVRENALRLAEPRLAASPALVAAVLARARDESAKVRFQLLCTLGDVDSPVSRAVQDDLLRRDIEDEWVQVAALSASPERASAYLKAALLPGSSLTAAESSARAGFLRRAAGVVGARPASAELDAVLFRVAGATEAKADWWRAAVAEGLSRGAQERGALTASARGRATLLDLAFDRVPAVRRASLQMLAAAKTADTPSPDGALRRAEALASKPEETADRRADAVRLLAVLEPAPRKELFQRLLDPHEPDEVQAAAVQGLGRIPGDDVGTLLLGRWRSFSAPVRSEAANALLAGPGRTRLLVAALRKGDVQTWALTFGQKRELIMNDDPEVRALARPLLEQPPEEREKVMKRYEAALDRDGDPRRGREVFDRVCAKCHRLDGQGAEVGPDLGSVRNRAASLLLADILLPSRAIAQNYESYVVETAGGDVLEGVIASQTPTAVALRREGAEERVVPRSSIRKMVASNLSAMPADLEQQVDVQQMADLLALLSAGRR